MKVRHIIFFLFFLLIMLSSAAAEEKDKTEELQTIKEERLETLKYGIDSEIITLLGKMTDEEDKTLADTVAEIYGETSNPDIMKAAVDYFVKMEYSGATDTAAVIIQNWEDESFDSLSSALRYISAYPDDTTEELILPLTDNDNMTLASSALTALGKCGSEKSVDHLLDLIDDDDYPDELKPTIIKALGDIGSTASLDLLIDILDDVDEEKSWRWNACEALGKIADPEALPAIEAALQDKDTYLRSYAVKALAEFEGPDVEETLIQSLRDSFWRVRVSAAEALGIRKSLKAVDILKYKAEKDPENNVRMAAIEALGEIADSSSLDFLRELYSKSTTKASIRTKAAEIIIEKDIEGSVETIIGVLAAEWSKDKSDILGYTCKFLSKAKSPKLEPVFERMLGYNDVAVKIYGIRGIALNNFTTFKDKLKTMTEEGVNNSVRREALSAIEEM